MFVATERIRSHLPVTVRQGSDEIRAGGIEADNLAQQLQLAPPVRASLSPRATRRFGAPRDVAMSGANAPLVFITGASSGIGQALAQRFHAAGWRLALAARRVDELRRVVLAQALQPSTKRRCMRPMWPMRRRSRRPADRASSARGCPMR